MIVANHMGEGLVPSLVAGGAGVVSVLLVVTRVHAGRLARVFRRRRSVCAGRPDRSKP